MSHEKEPAGHARNNSEKDSSIKSHRAQHEEIIPGENNEDGSSSARISYSASHVSSMGPEHRDHRERRADRETGGVHRLERSEGSNGTVTARALYERRQDPL